MYILVRHTKRIKAKNRSVTGEGGCVLPLTGKAHSAPFSLSLGRERQKGQRSLVSMPQETLFSNLWGGGGEEGDTFGSNRKQKNEKKEKRMK